MNDTEYKRTFLYALFFEQDHDFNPAWFLTILMTLVGMVGFLWIIFNPATSIVVQVVAWTFLAGAFASILIASLPVAKAKILANSTLPTEFAKTIVSAGKIVEDSTDIQELRAKEEKSNPEKG